MLKKKLQWPKWSDLKIDNIKTYKKIILTNKNGFLEICYSKYVDIHVLQNAIQLTSNFNNKKYFKTILTLFLNALLDIHQYFFYFFKIQGPNYSIILENNFIILFLGTSHSFKIKIPSKIFFYSIKDFFVLKSIDRQRLFVFFKFLQNLKKQNLYTGSGFLLPFTPFKKKPGKKK